MAEKEYEDKDRKDYEEPSLVDLEDVAGGTEGADSICITGGSSSIEGTGDASS